MLRKIGRIGVLIVAIAYPTFAALSQATDSVPQQLIGRWEGQIKAVNAPMELLFSPSGKFIAVFQSSFGIRDRTAFVVNYSVDSTSKPMHLDFQLPSKREKSVFTIFDLPDPHTLRLQIKDLAPGKPRPTQFEDEAQLTKVSDTAIAFPDAAQLAQAKQSNDGEGRLVMRSLAMSSLYYRLEQQQFPATLNQLGLNNNATQNYRYQLQAKSDQLTLTARPKKQNLKSYIAIVLRFPVQDQDYGTTAICESVRPSRIAPPAPRVPNPPNTFLGLNMIRCGPGSDAIGF